MKTVVHVINRIGSAGGAEGRLEANLARFDRERFRHVVVHLYTDDSASSIEGIECHSLSSPGVQTSRLRMLLRLRRLVGELDPDVIHCSLADASLLARIVGRLERVPVLESLVNISHEPIRMLDNPAVSPIKLRLHRIVDTITMRWVSHFHALSGAVADSWVEFASIEIDKVTVIPRGIDIAGFDAVPPRDEGELRASLDLGERSPILINVARQEPQKGQRYLLEALPLLKEEFPGLVVLMVGRSGNSTPELRATVDDLGLGDDVRWLGERSDVVDLLRLADAFVFPSLFEGLGVALLEAMVVGVPVAVSDGPPFGEVIEDGRNGVMFRRADPHSLAAALARLLRLGPSAEALAREARKDAEARFSLEANARRLEDLYGLVSRDASA